MQALKREDPHSLSLHEDLELGSHLGELRRMVSQAAGTVGGCSLQAVQPALAGIAAARHLPEVIRRLKQKNLEVCLCCGQPFCWTLVCGACRLNAVLSLQLVSQSACSHKCTAGGHAEALHALATDVACV